MLDLLRAAAPLWAWWLIVNLAGGAYAAMAFAQQLDFARQLRSLRVRVLFLIAFACFGVLVMLWLAMGDALYRRRLYQPPVRRRG